MSSNVKFSNGKTYYAVTGIDNDIWELTYIGWLNGSQYIFCETNTVGDGIHAGVIIFDSSTNRYGWIDSSEGIDYPIEIYGSRDEAKNSINFSSKVKELRTMINNMTDEELIELLGD